MSKGKEPGGAAGGPDDGGGFAGFGGGILTATIQKVDGCYFVRLPAYIAERFNMKESEVVHVHEEFNKIILQRSFSSTIARDINRKSIDELFEDYDGEYEPILVDWGRPVGREIW